MSQKKRKKQNHRSSGADQRIPSSPEPQDSRSKRICPETRSLLLGDMVLLGVLWLLETAGWISQNASAIGSLVGIAVLLYALQLQLRYSKGGGSGGSRGPRL